MPDFITPALATDWIPRLVSQLASLRGARRDEITRISDEFSDVELLAKSYIDPDCQSFNPADYDEDEPGRVLRSPIRDWVNEFLKGEYTNHDGRHVVFILSDAGMGKTSLLMMLKLSHLLSFWPQGLEFELMKLGEDTLERVESFKNRRRIVLLLDSLDEDLSAWGRIEERLQELLQATQNFRQVFITCRTQFFPHREEVARAAIERPGKVEVEGFVCNLLYLSPFSDEQVQAYLSKLYSTPLTKIWRWLSGQESRRVEAAEKIVLPMKSLRMRPMLLAYIQDLMDSKLDNWGEFAVYETLVLHWLRREKRKQKAAGGPEVEDLLVACQLLARKLHAEGRRSLPEAELKALVEDLPVDLSKLDVGGRSLLNRTSAGEFRFSHYSIQEFLIVQGLLSAVKPLDSWPERLTEQIKSFFVSSLGDPRWSWDARLAALEALGRAGDPRFAPGEDTSLEVPGLKGWRLGKCPVTVQEYRRFVEAEGYGRLHLWSPAGWKERTSEDWEAPASWKEQLMHLNRPVVGVSWFEATAYCRWLSKELDATVRLPSEAEWQKAASPDRRKYPWGEAEPSPELANFDNNVGSPTPVGLYPAGNGPFGHCDLAGNVWEWSTDPYSRVKLEDKEAAVRVVRGGSWADESWCLPAAIRFGDWPGGRDLDLGFRVLCRFRPEP